MIIAIVFICHGAMRPRGVTCKIGKANNLINLQWVTETNV